MHPALLLLIALVVPSIIVGAVIAVDAVRNAPVGREDENGFWYADGNQMARTRETEHSEVAPTAPAGRLSDYANTATPWAPR